MAIGQAGFNPDKIKGCPPLVVNFTDSSAFTPTEWLWDFGNGNTSNLQNPSATFLQPGTYNVKLVVKNGTQVDSVVKPITVFHLPVVDFLADKPSACFYDTVHFTPNVTPGDAPITDYGWGFGNGLASSQKVTKFKYNKTGAYTITLVVQDSNKCSASKTVVDYIHVWDVPTASFTASPNASCLPTQLVTFTNHSTGNGLTYTWDLDGTGTVSDENPTHLYHRQKYNASLKVTDVHGCRSLAVTPIMIAALSADFKASKYLVCTGDKVQFTNTSNFTGNKWFWDFGDSTTSTDQNPEKVYNKEGIFDVKFKISDGTCKDSANKPNYMNVRQGAHLPDVTISSEADSGTKSCHPPLTVTFHNTTPGAIIGYQWTFGDGNLAITPDATNTFTTSGSFTVQLTIVDSAGCKKTGIFPDYVSTSGPAATFEYYNSCPGAPVKFANTSGGEKAFWDFGDSTTSSDFSPSHKYAKPGTYMVSLTSTSSIGCVTYGTSKIVIDTVHVDFTVNQTFSPCPPFVALFKNKTTQKGLKYSWDFGDGYRDTASNPTHIFFYPGVYTVRLLGYNAITGCSDTVIKTNLITVQGPTGEFSVYPTSGCTPLNCSFSAKPSANTKTVWSDRGDGKVVNDTLQYTYTYTDPRIYHPQFVLTDHVGCMVSYPLDSVWVHEIPQAASTDTSVCAGASASIHLNSNAEFFAWSPSTFTDCDTCKNAIVTSPDTITYQVTARSKFGCATNTSFTVNVEPLPKLLPADTINLCKKDTFRLYAGDAQKMRWSPPMFIDDSTAFHPLCAPATSVEYTATGYNQLGCTTQSKVTINLQDKLDIEAPGEIKVCEFDTVQLKTIVNFSSAVGLSYSWSPAGYLNNPGAANPVANMTRHSINFQVIANSGNCVADTATVSVVVVPTPDIEVSSSVQTTPFAEVPLYAASHNDLNYTWISRDSISCTDCRRTMLYPATSQVVYVEGRNEMGCVVRDSVNIQVSNCNANAVFVPNTFTPNGDGVNDRLYLRTDAIANLGYFRVFDQWGELVYETHQLDQGWDGNLNGKPEGTGVYVYVIEGKCQNGNDLFKTGNVTAIR